MTQMQQYLEDVRKLAAARILDAQFRKRAESAPLHWAPNVSLTQGWKAPLGESYHHGGFNDGIWIYPDGNMQDVLRRGFPFGRVVAFTLIHELAHYACRCSLHHEEGIWAWLCQEMGIKEDVYSKKGPDWEYGFHFRDMELWAKILALPSYPIHREKPVPVI